jgi:integrase
MMDASMPRPRPPHLHRQVTRHGKTVWYVRVAKGARIRIRAEFGSTEFYAEYQSALSGSPLTSTKNKDQPQGTLAWLFDRYRENSLHWGGLKLATRRQHENIFRRVLESPGSKPFAKIDALAINAGIERRAKTSASQARHFLIAMRGLFRWALKAGHVKVDPTAGIETPQLKTGDGFIAWTEADVEAYHRVWTIGTRQRVWLDVLLYTGLRIGDAFRFGKQHVGQMKTEKTGQEVYPEIADDLAKTLAAGPIGDLTFIVSGNGRPFTSKKAFGNAFSEACRAAGVAGSAHGVRKLAATREANAGASEATLEAIFGWRGGHMASLYTRTANRKRLAKGTMNNDRTSIPSPHAKVRAAEEKTK